jgi:hypothetical protein
MSYEKNDVTFLRFCLHDIVTHPVATVIRSFFYFDSHFLDFDARYSDSAIFAIVTQLFFRFSSSIFEIS